MEANCYDVVSTLLEDGQGGDLEAFNEAGASPLMDAAKRGDHDLVEILLRDGQVDPNALNSARQVQKGQSALHVAASAGHTNVVEVLIQFQAQVDLRDSDQKTPLMTAAARAKSETVTLLLEEGADPVLKCNTAGGGWKASDYARMQGEDTLASAIDEYFVKTTGGDYPESNEDDDMGAGHPGDERQDAHGAENAENAGDSTPIDSTSQQPQSSSGGNTTNVDDTRSESLMSEGMSEVMGNRSHDPNESGHRDGSLPVYDNPLSYAQINASAYRDGSVLSELSEGMSEVQNISDGRIDERNEENESDPRRQQESMLADADAQPDISELDNEGQESEFELSDAEGTDDDELNDNAAQLISLRNMAAMAERRQGNGRSESVLSEGMSEVMGAHSANNSQSGSLDNKPGGGSSEVSSGMQELASPGRREGAGRNTRPEAPANLSSQSGMTSDDGDQSGSLLDELNPLARAGGATNRNRPEAPANLSSQSGMTSDDGDQSASLVDVSAGDQSGSLIDELDPQSVSRQAEGGYRGRPEAPANLSSHSNQSGLSSSEGDHSTSINEDDEKKQQNAAALLREKQAKLFGYSRDAPAVAQGNLDFVESDSGSDSEMDRSIDDPKQEPHASIAPEAPHVPPPSSSSSANPPIVAATENLSDGSDWDSSDHEDEAGAAVSTPAPAHTANPVLDADESAKEEPRVQPAQSAGDMDNADTAQTGAATINDANESDWDSPEPGMTDTGDIDQTSTAPVVEASAAQNTTTTQPPTSGKLSAAQEAKLKRLAAKDQKEAPLSNASAAEMPSQAVRPAAEDVQAETAAPSDYDRRRAEAAKKEQDRIRQLEIDMRSKMTAARNAVHKAEPAAAAEAEAAAMANQVTDNKYTFSPGASSMSPSRFDDNDDSSSTMDSTLIQQVYGLPVRSVTLQRTASGFGFKLIQAPKGTVGVRFDQIIAMSQAENVGCQVNDVIVAVGETVVLRNNSTGRSHVNVVRDTMLESGDVIRLHVVKGDDFDPLEQKAAQGPDSLSFSQMQTEHDDASSRTLPGREVGEQEIRENQDARLLAEKMLQEQRRAEDNAAAEAAVKHKAEVDALKSKEVAEAQRAQQAEDEAARLREQIADAAEHKKLAALQQAAETLRAQKAEADAAEFKRQMALKEAEEALRAEKADAEAAALKKQAALERAAVSRAAEEAAEQKALEIESQTRQRIQQAQAEALSLKQQVAHEKQLQIEQQAAYTAMLERQKEDVLNTSRQAIDDELEKSRLETKIAAAAAQKVAEQEIHENKMARLLAEKMLQDKTLEMQNKISRIEAKAQDRVQAAKREAEVQRLQGEIELRQHEEVTAREKNLLQQQIQMGGASDVDKAQVVEMKAKIRQLESDNKNMTQLIANDSYIPDQRHVNQSFFAPGENMNMSYVEPRNATTEELEDTREQNRVLSKQIVTMSERLAKEEQRGRELQMACDDKEMHLRVKDSQVSDLKTRMAILDTDYNETSQQLTKERQVLDTTVATVTKLTAERSRFQADIDDAKAQSEELYKQTVLKDQLLEQQSTMSEKKAAEARAARAELHDALIKLEGLETSNRELLALNDTLSVESKEAHERQQKQIEQYASTHKVAVANLEVAAADLKQQGKDLASRDEKCFELEMQMTSAKTKVEAIKSAHAYDKTRCQKLLQENSQLKQQLKQNQNSGTQTAAAVAELDSIKAKFEAANGQITGLSNQLSLAQQAQMSAESERATSIERIAALENSASSQSREVDSLIKQLEAKDTELVHAREKQAVLLNGTKKDHASQYERLVAETSVLRETHERLRIEYTNAQNDKKILEVERDKQQANLEQALMQLAGVEARVQSAKSRHKTILADSDAKMAELHQTKEQCVRLEGEMQGFKSANQQMETLTTSQRAEIVEFRTTVGKQEEEINLLRENKQELERIILATDSSSKGLKSALLQEEARKNTLEHGIEGLIEQKDVRAQLLSDNQAKCADLERELTEHLKQRQAAEVKAGEFEQLWQNEVASRNKAGAKILEMERSAAKWEERVEKEKARTAEALRRKQDLESRMQGMHKRVAELEGKTATIVERFAATERELVEYKTGNRRSPAIQAFIGQEQQNLQSKIHLLESELSASREQVRAASAAASDSAIKLASGAYVSREELELYKREIDLKAKQKISSAREELNEMLLRSKLQHEAQLVGMSREASFAKTQAAENKIKQLEYETNAYHSSSYYSSLAVDKADLSAMASRARTALAPLNRSSAAWKDLQAAKAAYQTKKSAAASKREQTVSMLSNRSIHKPHG